MSPHRWFGAPSQPATGGRHRCVGVQINQLHDFNEILRQQLEATREERDDRRRQRAQYLMLELKVLSGLPWWKRLTG